MSGGASDYVQAAATLRRGLEDAADALGRADLEGLLAGEARIHAALTHLAGAKLSEDSRAALAREIVLARGALTRCRRLGESLNDFVRLALGAQGLDEGYGPRTGRGVELHTIHRTA